MSVSKQQQAYAIVIGIDTMQGLQTARILAGHDIPVIGLASNMRHHACRTRVCEEILQADTNGESLIQTLISLGPTLPAKAVLYPCHDQCVWLISRGRAALQDWYHVMLADAGAIETLIDKDRFYPFASEQGVAVPQTFVLRCRDDADEAAEKVKFPCVVKPVRRSPQWNAKTMSKAFLAEDSEDFLTIYERVKGWEPELMAQQWIMGADDDLYSCNCYFDRRSKLVASFIARKLRQWPPQFGSSCLGEECRNDVVLNAAVGIFERIGYVGLGYIEMKRDARTGEYFAIEANVGRPTGRSAIAEAGGVDMLYAMYCDAVGQALPTDLEQKYLGVKWIDLRHDIQSAIHYYRNGELTLADWYNSWRGRKVHAVFSLRDPLPFFADFWHAILVVLSPKERALRQHFAFVKSTKSVAAPSATDERTKP
jgi:D-aspartate ligase